MVPLLLVSSGVFKDVVEWCLVVTTPEEAILCALARSDGQANGGTTENGFAHRNGALRLIPTRYVIPTDSVPLLSVCGTSDGRIFMGGFDGSIYEMAYEGMVDPSEEKPPTLERRLEAFYDGNELDVNWDQRNGNNSVARKIVSSGKRALSTVIYASNGSDGSARPQKCRKLNHSSRVSSLFTAVVPSFLTKASSSLFGTGISSTGGGPIVRLLVDEERSCIYTLSSRGWICVFDLGPPAFSTASASAPQAKLTAVVDTAKTARLYLEAVSRGRMYPPSSHSSYVANITFPGGGASAQAGVGGMDGARSILKVADSEVQRERNGARDGKKANDGGVLTPVSIHIVSRKESGRLTLVAVTKGGLRYYLSSLSSSVLNAGPTQQIASSRKTDPLAPTRKFTLCHIRAPPPVAANGLIQGLPSFESDSNISLGGFIPKMAVTAGATPRVDASYYDNGVSLLALEWKGGNNSGQRPSGIASTGGSSLSSPAGDIVVAATPDSVRRKKETTSSTGNMAATQSQILTAPGGISETLHQPTAALSDSSSVERAPTLPGGRVWAMCSSVSPASSSLFLALSSQTPTDVERSVGLVPAFFPPSRVQSRGGATSALSNTARSSSLNIAETSTATDSRVVANGGASASSIAFTLFTNFLFSRPLRHGLSFQKSLPQLESASGTKLQPLYRISTRYGFGGAPGKSVRGGDGGTQGSVVSVTRPERSTAGSTPKAARLSPWLLRPAIPPLNPLSVQHLTPSSGIVALNAGGLHYFQCKTVLSNLTEAIMASGINIGRDEAVTSFFNSYGYKQGCAMCLALAVGCGPGADGGSYGEGLRKLALQAALNRALQPRLVPVTSGTYGVVVEQPQSADPAVPRGYEFRPSSLVDGFTLLLSRLLRPIWYKPAVVVTEGRSIRRKIGGTMNTPARVELLLDDVTLEEIRKPLHAMQALMKETFPPAVNVVPGVQRMDNDVMDIDDDNRSGGHDLFTRAMQQQFLARSQINGVSGTEPHLTSTEIETIARLIEERNLHSIYRLLSRTVQLLNLLSLLKRAQLMSDLPEVEWGRMHGLTISQLVQTRNGQERIETLLNSLVSSTASATVVLVTPSADADRLANLFASQCYLFFSPGSRLAYLGYRSAGAALSCPASSARRSALTSQASAFLKRAARYWYNPKLITGRILHSRDKKSFEQVAVRAMQFDSPVAKAAVALMQLEDVTGVVDVCLETASNFSERRSSQKLYKEASAAVQDVTESADILFWEQGLYHRRRDQGENGQNVTASPAAGVSTSSTSAVAVGADVTPKDAIRTCHAIIFYHLSTLLDSPNTHLADKMVAHCAASSDKEFLHSLYAHLLSTNHVDSLLRIDSSEVEKWLKRPDADTTMLWRFYVVQGKNVLAGEVMWRRACDTQREASLNERVEFLTRALDSYNAALEQSSRGVMQWNRSVSGNQPDPQELRRMITQIREMLEVAMLQHRVLNTVTGSSLRDKLKDDQYVKLSSELVPVSDLYNEFAGPLNLFDLCLLILHSCHHNDTQMIETLWKSILCEELLPCSTRSTAVYNFLQNLMARSMVEESVVLIQENGGGSSGAPVFENGDWTNALKARVASLGKEVFGKGADYVFPVEFIAANLEGEFYVLAANDLYKAAIYGTDSSFASLFCVKRITPYLFYARTVAPACPS